MSIIFSGNGSIETNGVVPIAQGGTGKTTRETAINALLPDQSGNENKILVTDGTNVSWTTNTGGGTSLPEFPLTGAGYFLSTDGTNLLWDLLDYSKIQPAGITGQLQFNYENILAATNKISYNTLDVLTVGDGKSDTFKISGEQAFDMTYSGSTVVIKGGDSFPNTDSSFVPQAGNVVIMGGGGFGEGAPGNIIFKIGKIQDEVFRITGTGSWSIGNDGLSSGASGNFLMSRGAQLSPQWSALPIASDTVLGAVKIQNNSGLEINSQSGELFSIITGVDGTSIKLNNRTLSTSIYDLLPIEYEDKTKFLYVDTAGNFSWTYPTPEQILPPQAGNTNKFLTTNGFYTRWDTPFPDQTNNENKFLMTNGVSVSWVESTIPPATDEVLGLIKVDDSTIKISNDGTIRADVNELLPNQDGNEDLYLKTNGQTLVWAEIPPPYNLPVAGTSSGTLGGVRVGDNVTLDSNTGVISVNKATNTILGVVSVGENIDVSNGEISVKVASDTELGLVKFDGTTIALNENGQLKSVISYLSPISLTTAGDSGAAVLNGTTLNIPQYQRKLTLTTEGSYGSASIVDGTLNIPQYNYELPIATINTLGGVRIGESLIIDDYGVVNAPAYSLPTASTLGLGGVIVDGNTITIDGNGVIRVAASLQGTVTSVGFNTGSTGLTVGLPQATSKTITGAGEFVLGGTLAIANGGTGSTEPSEALTALGGVSKSGDTMTGALFLNADPTLSLHAATKQYVDNLASGLTIKTAARTATTTALVANYQNGTQGEGATLVGTTSLPIIGGVTLAIGDRVLVKNQSNTAHNGMYEVTATANPYILTRTFDFNTSASIQAGDAFFVGEGTLTGTQWIMNTPGTLNVGTSSIVFTQFGGPGSLIGGTGITITSNTITNSGVTSLIGGNNINVTSATGAVTINFDGVLAINKGGTGASDPASALNALLPSQVGKNGKFLHTDGAVASWSDLDDIPIPGQPGEILFNNNGVIAGSPRLTFNGISKINIGDISAGLSSDIFELSTPQGVANGGSSKAPLSIMLRPGVQPINNGQPGNILLRGGAATGAGVPGGAVYIDGGSASESIGGSVIIRTTGGAGTALVNRLAILDRGAWSVDGQTGVSGQVLVSQGNNSSPIWSAMPASAENIIGTTLPETLTTSSLTTVGTLTSLNVDGYVGIGTTTPQAPLVVADVISGNELQFIPESDSSSIAAINGNDGSFSSITLVGSSVSFKTASDNTITNRLTISNNGAWQLGDVNPSSGTSGQVLTSKGPNLPPIWQNVPTASISGGNTGLSTSVINDVVTLGGVLKVEHGGTGATDAQNARTNLGAAKSGTNGDITSMTALTQISLPNSTNDGQSILIKAGDGSASYSGYAGGSITLQSGLDGSGTNGTGQNIILQVSSSAPSTGSNFIVRHNANTERFRINKSGAWGLSGTNYGTSGQVLTSAGGSSAPLWKTITSSDVLPTQTDNDGKFLTTNGTTVSWGTPAINSSFIDGTIEISKGGTGQATEQAAINALTQNSSTLANTVLRSNGSNVTLSKIQLNTDVSNILSLANGGTGANDQAGAARAILPPQANKENRFLTTDGTNASWGTAVSKITLKTGTTGLTVGNASSVDLVNNSDVTIAGVLNVPHGGTGANSLSGYIKGNGSNAMTAVASIPLTDTTGTLPITRGGTDATTQAAAARNILPPQSAANGLFLTSDGTNASWGTPALSASGLVGTVSIEKGGTNATTQAAAARNILPSQSGKENNYLTSNGTDAVWSALSVAASNISGTITATKGGTGHGTYATGDLLIGGASNTLTKLGIGSTGQVLTVISGAPAWGPASTTTPGGPTLVTNVGVVQVRSNASTFTGSNDLTIDLSTGSTAGVVSFGKIPRIGSGASALEIGYLGLPRVTTFDANAKGKRIAVTAGVTIPSNTYAAGDAFSFYNDSAVAITFTQGSGMTLRKDGTANTGNFTLAARGTAFLWFNSATEAILTGSIT